MLDNNLQPATNEIVILDCNNIENQANNESNQNKSHDQIGDDSTDSPKEIKGFKRDTSNNIICLDCGRMFKQKNSYNYHKRM